jgi:hypothetical protein
VKNLELTRGSRNAWDRLETPAQYRRLAVIVTAAAVVVFARRRSWVGRLASSAAAALVARAVAGHDDLGTYVLRPRRAMASTEVDTASADSFPASDAPAWTPTAGASAGSRPSR